MAGGQYGADSLSDDVAGHSRGVAAEESRIVGARAAGKCLEPGPGSKGGAGFVEADVPVRADAEQLHVHTAGREKVVSVAGWAPYRLGTEVEPGCDRALDDCPVGLRMAWGEPDVLVEEKGLGPPGRKTARLMTRNEVGVDGLGRAAGCQSEHRIGLPGNEGGDGPAGSCPATGPVGHDHDFHAYRRARCLCVPLRRAAAAPLSARGPPCWAPCRGAVARLSRARTSPVRRATARATLVPPKSMPSTKSSPSGGLPPRDSALEELIAAGAGDWPLRAAVAAGPGRPSAPAWARTATPAAPGPRSGTPPHRRPARSPTG